MSKTFDSVEISTQTITLFKQITSAQQNKAPEFIYIADVLFEQVLAMQMQNKLLKSSQLSNAAGGHNAF